MRKLFYIIFFCQFFIFSGYAQKINSDSLLLEGLKSLKQQDYKKAIEQGRLGVKIAPEYTDFHMLLGRVFMKTNKPESAQYYFNHVIATNPIYKDAFTNSINIFNSTKEYDNALERVDKAIEHFGEDKDFYDLKLKTLQLKKQSPELVSFLNEMIQRYPNKTKFQELLSIEESKFISDRIGINHTYSTFNRDGVGPWNLTGIQYVRERKKNTFIGRINYVDRRGNGTSLRTGYQFEVDSYIKTGKNGNSIFSVAFSNDDVFPKLRLSYSYLYSFENGWEVDAGLRYIKPSNNENIYVTALGLGKYFGSSWVNVSTFLFSGKSDNFLSIGGTYRYYFNTKDDYFSVVAGYGNSPDETLNLTPNINQVSLDSYRAGAGFNKIIGKKVILSLQFIANRQEYISEKYQNQFNFYAGLQYKL